VPEPVPDPGPVPSINPKNAAARVVEQIFSSEK